MLKEECGVVGIYSNKNVSPSIYYGLLSLQHRGQESCGITTFDRGLHTEKGMGLVPEFFDLKKLEALKGKIGIGHVRYSTTGDSRIENAQPFVVTHSKGSLAIAHNGNLVNSKELRKKLEADGQAFVSTTDTEVIAHLIVREFVKTDNIIDSIAEVMKGLIGSYSLVILAENELIAVRDPLGIRPLNIGNLDDPSKNQELYDQKGSPRLLTSDTYIIASESVVFDILNINSYQDVKPGEIISINENGIKRFRPIKLNRKAHCMFEYVYFSRPDSVLNGIPVYTVREKIGRIHGELDDVEVDFVSPIPDSAIPFAMGYSKQTGIPYRESLIRNRYVGRTFILPDQEARELAVRLKLNPMLSEVKDKRIILFDDSIVRGTTSGRVIKILKDAGAREVHMRVGCPPIKSLCNLGIDMPADKELIASEKSIEEIRESIGADSLRYIQIEGLMKAIGLKEDELCLGCLTSKYPIEISKHEQALLPSFYDGS